MRENHLGPPEGTLFQQKNVIYSIQLNELLLNQATKMMSQKEEEASTLMIMTLVETVKPRG